MFIEEKERSNQTRRWEAGSRVLLGDFFFFFFFFLLYLIPFKLAEMDECRGEKNKVER